MGTVGAALVVTALVVYGLFNLVRLLGAALDVLVPRCVKFLLGENDGDL